MSSLKQNIRSVLSEVESFLVETLKSVKLNGNAKDQKDRLLEKIRQLLDEIPGSASSQLDSNASGGSLKMSAADSSSGGTSSGNLQSLGDDDSGYADNIPKKAVNELKNILQSGMLEKKKKSGFKTWEQLYCVISGNIMYMYKKQGDSKQKEAFCLSGYEIQEAPGLDKDASRKEMCFEVIKAGAPTYQFRAGSKEGMVIWKESIVKGIQIAAEEEPGEMYEDLGGDNDSGGNFPPGPPILEDPEDIYEECGDQEPPPPPPSQPRPPTFKPPPPVEVPEEMYDDCASAGAAEKKADVPPPPGRRREPPPLPSSSSSDPPPPPPPKMDLPPPPPNKGDFPPPPPPPKADLPPVPTSLPPPIPDRKGDAPPLPNIPPPPVPGRGGAAARVPQLRKPFMDRDEDFENVFYGKWDCAADNSKELAFKQGDMIHVLSRDFDTELWWVGELEGKVGLVPKEYLCPAFELVP